MWKIIFKSCACFLTCSLPLLPSVILRATTGCGKSCLLVSSRSPSPSSPPQILPHNTHSPTRNYFTKNCSVCSLASSIHAVLRQCKYLHRRHHAKGSLRLEVHFFSETSVQLHPHQTSQNATRSFYPAHCSFCFSHVFICAQKETARFALLVRH